MDKDHSFGELLFKYIAAKNVTLRQLITLLNERLVVARNQLIYDLITTDELSGWMGQTIDKPTNAQFEALQNVLIIDNAGFTEDDKRRHLWHWRLAYRSYEIDGSELSLFVSEAMAAKNVPLRKLIDSFEHELRIVLGVDTFFQHENLSEAYLGRLVSGREIPSQATASLLCKVLGVSERDREELLQISKNHLINKTVVAFPQDKTPGRYHLYTGSSDPILNGHLNDFYSIKSRIISIFGDRVGEARKLSSKDQPGSRRFHEIININSSLGIMGDVPIEFLSVLESKSVINEGERKELTELFQALKRAIGELRRELGVRQEKNYKEVNTIPLEHVHPNFNNFLSRVRRPSGTEPGQQSVG